jgi:hypothetical protein
MVPATRGGFLKESVGVYPFGVNRLSFTGIQLIAHGSYTIGVGFLSRLAGTVEITHD